VRFGLCRREGPEHHERVRGNGFIEKKVESCALLKFQKKKRNRFNFLKARSVAE